VKFWPLTLTDPFKRTELGLTVTLAAEVEVGHGFDVGVGLGGLVGGLVGEVVGGGVLELFVGDAVGAAVGVPVGCAEALGDEVEVWLAAGVGSTWATPATTRNGCWAWHESLQQILTVWYPRAMSDGTVM